MAKGPDFKRLLTRTIKLKGGSSVLLETLNDLVKFIASMKPWQQTRPYWEHRAGEILKVGVTGKYAAIVEATRRLEIALRRDDWL